MNVWVVNHYAGHPAFSKSGSRHHSIGRVLRQRGWNVTIIAADTDHPTGARVPGLPEQEVVDGIGYRWIRVPEYSAGHGLSRILNMLAFAAKVALPRSTAASPAPDVVIGSTVHPFAAWAARRIARRYDVPFVLEIRDLWPETLVQVGSLSRRHPLVRLLARVELSLSLSAAAIVTTMPNAVEYLAGRGIAREKVHWISNGVDLERFPVTTAPPRATTTFMYFGALGPANAVQLLLDGFALARERGCAPATLRIVGDGPDAACLRERAGRLGLSDTVSFEPAVPREEIPALATGADAFVACTLPLALYKYGVSLNKLFEYLAAARPILFAGAREANPVADSPGVLVVDPTVAAIADGFARVAALSRVEAERWGAANHAFAAQRFSFATLGDRLAGVLAAV